MRLPKRTEGNNAMPWILNQVNKPVQVALGSPQMMAAANCYLTEGEAKSAQRQSCPHPLLLGNSKTGRVCCAECGQSIPPELC